MEGRCAIGYGDVLLAAAHAQETFDANPALGPVTILDVDGHPRWREEWAGHPAIRQSGPIGSPLKFGRGCLPYHPWTPDVTWRARDHVRPRIYLTPAERQLGVDVRARVGPFVLIEPPGLDRKNRNRVWPGWSAFSALLLERLDLALVQLDRPEADPLPGVGRIPHRNFREACGILKAADLAVVTEGGIAFGAIAVKTLAVVLWGGCVSVETFGYPEHVNLCGIDPQEPCESSKPCNHCAVAWAALTPESVASVVVRQLETP